MKDLEQFGFRKGFNWETRFNLKTQVGKYEVSTVDLGLNHQFDETLPPLYYETMIFIKGNTFEERHSEENPFEYYQERYTTEEEARLGHKKAIEYVEKWLAEKSDK